MFLFTSESVSEGHPDKIADQISDAILDAHLAQDPHARVACEVLVTTGLVILAGEFRSSASVDFEYVARQVLEATGYTDPDIGFDYRSCGIVSVYHAQSPDIARGVDRSDEPTRLGAGDQGMMFGFATRETPSGIPFTLDLAHRLVHQLAEIRKQAQGPESPMHYLRPDAKSQVTVQYLRRGEPVAIDTILISTQHQAPEKILAGVPNASERFQSMLREDLLRHVVEPLVEVYEKSDNSAGTHLANLLKDFLLRLRKGNARFLVNPTGRFVIGGPHGDTGLTGRKTIVDTYGGWAPHGGGAFSGKDASKVDRSAAYMARYVAKNLVFAGVAREALIQVSYAIGVPEPIHIHVELQEPAPGMDPEKVRRVVEELFDFRPGVIIQQLGLDRPVFLPTAVYGHMGREPVRVRRQIRPRPDASSWVEQEVDLFTWEKTDRVGDLQRLLKVPAVHE